MTDSRKTRFWRELPFLILIALVLALLIKTFLVQAFFIPSGSMERTLHGCPGCSGDRVLVNKLVYRFRDPHRGEIVVFRGPASWQDTPEVTTGEPGNPVSRFFHEVGSALGVAAPSSKDFIKRVIGVPGDHVVCCDPQKRVTVNGHPLTEPYVFPGADPSDQPFDVTVPPGRLWVMGTTATNQQTLASTLPTTTGPSRSTTSSVAHSSRSGPSSIGDCCGYRQPSINQACTRSG